MAKQPDLVRVLRLQRTDESDTPLLLRVEQKTAVRPLDLKLVATDQEHVFHGSSRTAEISSLKSDRYTGTDDDLRDILYYCMLSETPDGVDSSLLNGIELVAAPERGGFALIVRRRLDEITSRIATLKLVQDDEREEINGFDWADTAVIATDRLRNELERAMASLIIERNKTKALEQELEDFITMKKENDTAMIDKFAALLNTKKHKIRELQAMTARTGPNAGAQPATQQAKNKRKAESTDSKDVEMDDVDRPDDEEMPTTPQETDDEHDDPEAAVSSLSAQLPSAEPSDQHHLPHIASSVQATPMDDEDDDTDDEL